MNFWKKNGMLIVVFLTGAAILVVEIIALRILSPYYGNTIFTASSVISVILAALSVGYYVGGKVADRRPSFKIFFGIILVGGLFVLLLRVFILIILPNISSSLSLIWGPLLSAVIMFFIPSFLLGMLSPFTIKLQQLVVPGQGIGTISGKIFFWSTLGSIFGSLMTGFVLIPNFGINNIITSVGGFLIFLGLTPLLFFGLSKKRSVQIMVVVLIVVGGTVGVVSSSTLSADTVYTKDGVYEKITIKDSYYNNHPARFFLLDNSLSSIMYLDSEELASDYSKYYNLYKVLKPEAKKILILGSAGYSIPKDILATMPEAEVDVVDIEPMAEQISKDYFNLEDNHRMTTYIDDARRFLKKNEQKYDIIFGDAFSSIYAVPSHLTTKEFFQLVKSRLTEDGFYIANFIGSLKSRENSYLYAQLKTGREVFDNSYFFAVRSTELSSMQNTIFIGYNSEKEIDFTDPETIKIMEPYIKEIDRHFLDLDNLDFRGQHIFVDDYAPVDYLVGQSLRKNN